MILVWGMNGGMKKTILVSMFISLVVVACGKNNQSGKSNPAATPVTNPVGVGVPVYPIESNTNELFARVNERRAAWGMPLLVRDSFLDAQANSFAMDLADGRRSEFHLKADLCDRMPRTSECRFMALSDRPMAGSVLNYWLSKPGRKRVLENPRLRRAGVGLSRDRNGQAVWVLVMLSH